MRKIEIFILLIIGINSRIFLDNSKTKPKNFFDEVILNELLHQIQKDLKVNVEKETLKNAIKFKNKLKLVKKIIIKKNVFMEFIMKFLMEYNYILFIMRIFIMILKIY